MGIEIPQEEPTSADEWPTARKRGFTVTLPSGAKARLRRTLDLPELVKSGKIPSPLADKLNEVITNATKALEDGEPVEAPKFKFSDIANAETVYSMLEVVNETCVRSFIEPKVMIPPEGEGEGWEAPAGVLSIFDLSLEDKMFVWQYAMGGAADLASFRANTKQTLDAAFNVPDVPLPTEQPAGAV